MENNSPEKERPSSLSAPSLTVITLLALLLFVAIYAAGRQCEKTAGDDSYYAAVHPECTLCWYEWMAEQANETKEP
jgi:hypothetical protein